MSLAAEVASPPMFAPLSTGVIPAQAGTKATYLRWCVGDW